MRSFFLDLKFVFRQLRQSPGFTATAVLMLALRHWSHHGDFLDRRGRSVAASALSEILTG